MANDMHMASRIGVSVFPLQESGVGMDMHWPIRYGIGIYGGILMGGKKYRANAASSGHGAPPRKRKIIEMPVSELYNILI